MVYLDYNATAPLRREARAALQEYLDSAAGNASSAHGPGRVARAALERARHGVATAVGVRASEVVFTSGGTESNNLAVLGSVGEPGGAHLVVSPIEHPSVLGPVQELVRRGAQVTWLPVDGEGRIKPDDVAAALRPNTALVSVGWANNEIGTVQPIAAIAALCRARQIRVHVDAVQMLGKLTCTLADIDLCSLSAHKLGGPIGAGALAVRGGVALRPLCFGGQQERARRPGTENVAAAVGFAAALAAGPADAERMTALRERLWSGVSELPGVRRYSPRAGCLPNTLLVGFAGAPGETVVAALDLEGVAASVGSACAVGSAEPSHVLRAIGCDASEARGGVRFSLGPVTTAADIDAAVAALHRVVARLPVASQRRAVG